MTDKHTPGPWTVGVTEEDGASWFEVRGAADGHGWATVVAGEVDNHADANLMVASPDMLAALEAMRDNPTIIAAVCPSPLWAQMINAIEKARGTE